MYLFDQIYAAFSHVLPLSLLTALVFFNKPSVDCGVTLPSFIGDERYKVGQV